jgi:hypothetical protein
MAKQGLTENCRPDALGLLMDLTEQYMEGITKKIIQKARIRLQET